MIVLEKCKCGRYNRYGIATHPSELDCVEHRMLNEAIRCGECTTKEWVCPFCREEVKDEDK